MLVPILAIFEDILLTKLPVDVKTNFVAMSKILFLGKSYACNLLSH